MKIGVNGGELTHPLEFARKDEPLSLLQLANQLSKANTYSEKGPIPRWKLVVQGVISMLILAACGAKASEGLSENVPTPQPDLPTQPTEGATINTVPTNVVPLEIISPVPPTILPSQRDVTTSLSDVPPDYLVGVDQFANYPDGSEAMTVDSNPEIGKALDQYGLSPMLGGSDVLTYGYDTQEAKFRAAPPSQITDRTTGSALTLVESGVDKDGFAEYKSGGIAQWGVMEIDCPEGHVCVPAVSYNSQDFSTAYWLEFDQDNKLVGKLRMIHDTKPAWNDKGELVVGGEVVGFEPIGDMWNDQVTGDRALAMMDNPMGVSYEKSVLDGSKVLQFVVDDKLDQAGENQIHYGNKVGYIENENGRFVWDGEKNEWQMLGPVVLEGGAQALGVDGKEYIETSNGLHMISDKTTVDGVTIAKLTDGSLMQWQDGGWSEYRELSREIIAGVKLQLGESYTVFGNQIKDSTGNFVPDIHIEPGVEAGTYTTQMAEYTFEANGQTYPMPEHKVELKMDEKGRLCQEAMCLENGAWVREKVLDPEGTETEYSIYSLQETKTMILEATNNITEVGWEKEGSLARKESATRANEIFGIDNTKPNIIPFGKINFEEEGRTHRVWDSRFYFVNDEGVKVGELPTGYFAYEELDNNGQSMVVFERSGEVVKVVINEKLGSLDYFFEHKVTPFTLTQVEYESIMSALTVSN